jgi:hypothetical protein
MGLSSPLLPFLGEGDIVLFFHGGGVVGGNPASGGALS